MKKTILILILVFIFLRVLNLDRDLPNYDLTQLGSKDEQAYNFTALNLYHFGAMNKVVADGFTIKGSITSILNNSVTYLTLTLFGNNYYGLRAGAVLASLVILLILLYLSGLMFNSGSNNLQRYMLLFIGLYALFDFGFLIAGRNASPVIFRSMYLMLIMLFMNFIAGKSEKEQKWYYLLCGLFSALLIFFSYLTNTFIALGIVLFIAFRGIHDRDFNSAIKLILLYIFGFIIGFLISNQIYIIFKGSGVLSSLFSTVDVYGNRLAAPVSTAQQVAFISLIKRVVTNLLFMVHSNIFTLNYTLLFLLITSFFIAFIQFVKRIKLSNVRLITLSMIIAYLVQAVIYNPNSTKWIVMIFPVIIVFVVSTISNVFQSAEIKEYLSNKKRFLRFFLVLNFLFITAVFVLLLKFGVSSSLRPLAYLSVITMFSLVVVLSFDIVHFSGAKKVVIAVLLMLSMLPNLYLSFINCAIKPDYHYRNALMTVNSIVKDDVVAGSWSDGFRLYTSGNTLFTWYQNQRNRDLYKTKLTEIFDKGIAKYTLDFSKRSSLDVFKDIDTKGKKYRLEIDTTLYLGYKSTADSLIVVKRIAIND